MRCNLIWGWVVDFLYNMNIKQATPVVMIYSA